MPVLSIWHLAGALLTIGLICAVGVLSGRGVKNAEDFATGGGKAGVSMVAGSIIGTLVGGSSTIATAQLAFQYGFSALWFNLGAGLGCLILALVFVKPMRHSGCQTIQQMIAQEYGARAGTVSSVLGSLGIFLNIVAQLLSAMALLSAVLPISGAVCAYIACVLMLCYVLFGGMRGTGVIGIIKTVLLYGAVTVCVCILLAPGNRFLALSAQLPRAQYFSLFARGIGVDGGAALSLILGVLSTQTYAQSILMGRSDKHAAGGALLSAILIPPIGIGSVLIGIYMRVHFPTMNPAQAFPQFILLHLPAFAGGVALAVLLIAIVGCGAGLALGIGSIVANNLCAGKNNTDSKKLLLNRGTILLTLLLAVLFTFGGLQSLILQWSFMSMGLRAAVVFLPMCGALFLPKCINRHFALGAILMGPLVVLAGKLFLPSRVDPLFWGIAAAFLCMSIGYLANKKAPATKNE